MSLQLRKAQVEDLDILAKMNKQLIEDEGSSNPMSLKQLKARMSGWLKSDWNIDLIMESESVIGYALYQFRNNPYDPNKKEVYIRQYFIERSYRNHGHGLKGIELLKEERLQEIKTLEIDVLEANEAGRNFWSKVGFKSYAVTMRLERE